MKQSSIRLGTFSALAFLMGCATPADPGRMTATTRVSDDAYPRELHLAMCVRSVTGGEETNPMWVSQVSSADFKTALAESMVRARLIAPPDACKYAVDVNLLGVSQPSGGWTMEVTSHANYKVFNAAAEPILLETVSAPFTATTSDAWSGATRLKIATEGAVRTSIERFLDKLRELKQF
jgi:hypothetical protein